jgi:predicted transcriptional regulator
MMHFTANNTKRGNFTVTSIGVKFHYAYRQEICRRFVEEVTRVVTEVTAEGKKNLSAL